MANNIKVNTTTKTNVFDCIVDTDLNLMTDDDLGTIIKEVIVEQIKGKVLVCKGPYTLRALITLSENE